MRKPFFPLIAGVITCIGATSFAQVSNWQKLDSFFSPLEKNQELNGSVLIADNGKVYKKSVGYADFEGHRKNTDSTVFQLASISKTFTAVATLQLVERGKFKLEDKLVRYFPEFPYADITVRHLLSHTSGLPDRTLFNSITSREPDRVFTNEDIIPELVNQHPELKGKPGERFAYNNIGFDLLALLVEKVSHEKFEDYLYRHVFRPAGMSHTFCRTTLIRTGTVPNEAYNYDYPFLFSSDMHRVREMFWLQREKAEYYNLYGLLGDGAIYSTTGDLKKYDGSLYDGTLLKPSTLALVFTPVRLTNGNLAELNIGIGKAYYCLGWEVLADTSAGKIVWHAGGRWGCWTIFLRNITRHQTAVVLTNTENSSGAYKCGLSAIRIMNGQAPLIPRQSLARIYGAALMAKGADFAAGELLRVKDDTLHYRFSESDMNDLGYELLANNHHGQALETFKLNALLFSSANAFDSYGEALLKAGKREEAAMMYRRSIDLNPANEAGRRVLKTLLP